MDGRGVEAELVDVRDREGRAKKTTDRVATRKVVPATANRVVCTRQEDSEFLFRDAEFEMLTGHPGKDVGWAVAETGLELRRQIIAGYIDLGAVSLGMLSEPVAAEDITEKGWKERRGVL